MGTKRVMIAEDHKETSQAISDFMRFIFPDFALEHAATGKDTVERMLKDPADVLVLDVALADDINGMDVIKKLWEGGMREKPRIIMITALGNKAFRGPRPGRPWVEQLNEHERTLVADFFEKPYGWHAFLTAVAKAAGTEPPEKIKLIPDNE
jgi:DNA-binding NtrC family response regulator